MGASPDADCQGFPQIAHYGGARNHGSRETGHPLPKNLPRFPMSPQERLNLIRARLNRPATGLPRPAGLHRRANPDAPRVVVRKLFVQPLNPSQRNWNVAGEYCPTSDNRPPWVYRPDKPKPVQCAIKRKGRVNPLTRIAEQLPVKLPVIDRTFQTQNQNR